MSYDFFRIEEVVRKNGSVEIYPAFNMVNPSTHLMIKGNKFLAVYDEQSGLWSRNEQTALRIIDESMKQYVSENIDRLSRSGYKVQWICDADTKMIDKFHHFTDAQMKDTYQSLDTQVIFSNDKLTRESYATIRLPYAIGKGDHSAWDHLVSTLYADDERHKIEWCIGAIITGASKTLQKFMVMTGSAGTGKSTIIKVLQMLFAGYCSKFESKVLGMANSDFALESFKNNPLLAYEDDGDLSHIEDNTRLNSLVSHETMTVNEKFKSKYEQKFQSFLIMGSNKPVRITDAKSGLLRRLIDVSPTGVTLSFDEYMKDMSMIEFELGAIAYHCREVYNKNPRAYDKYVPTKMMNATNDFYNFVEEQETLWRLCDEITLKSAWAAYNDYATETRIPYPMSQQKVKEELKNYFREFYERGVDASGERVRNLYKGFRTEKLELSMIDRQNGSFSNSTGEEPLGMKPQSSILDDLLASYPAQYANPETGGPTYTWDSCRTKLVDLDTHKLHYVRCPENLIVIDFDIPGENGEKNLTLNVEEASKWPSTYTEVSKSGNGVHLHYFYTGDVSLLAGRYDDKIEVKVFTGKSSLRRALSICNDVPIATISSGLPLKEAKRVIKFEGIKTEAALRGMIEKNLRKEIVGSTKQSVDLILKDLDTAYASGMQYDVMDLRESIMGFAASSTHNAMYCIGAVSKMRFKSKETETKDLVSEKPIIFFDIEVFKNMMMINWKEIGEGKPVHCMINPTPMEIEKLLEYRLVGFNNLDYDNHILYARYLGYNNERIYNLSKEIIEKKNKDAKFSQARAVSYTDIFDYCAKKQSLKLWEIELGLKHQEFPHPWDEPLDESLWEECSEYCKNDVLATEAVWNATQGDFTARKILAELAGGTVNDRTNALTTKIIFGNNKNPKLVYVDLKTGEPTDPEYKRTDIVTAFPEYEYKEGKNYYRGELMGFGGYIRSWPGVYKNVALLDVASLHPNSIRAMNCFGEYTKNFTDILDARIAIKHKDYDQARSLFGGRLAKYLDDPALAKQLAQALKIAINSVYGLTSASFANPFKDPRNVNNIVALRGGLFMKTLQDEITSRGYEVVAVKTDSIKIVNSDKAIVEFAMNFAKKYGYTFEHEATYEKMCQINDADYVAKYLSASECEKLYGYIPGDNREEEGHWTTTGAKFADPFVFKTVFTKEPIVFSDLPRTKSVKTSIYLDMNEALPRNDIFEKERDTILKKLKARKVSEEEVAERLDELTKICSLGHDYRFVGRVGSFVPIKPGYGGGILLRKSDNGYDAVTGTKGYRWLESSYVEANGLQDSIDMRYYYKLAFDARVDIGCYGERPYETIKEFIA